MIRIVEKGWGREVIFASHEDYCGKLLEFHGAGNKGSMHFHAKKQESWLVSRGSFLVRKIDTRTAEITETVLSKGDTVTHYPFEPHQAIALEENSTIFEVSTHDDPADSYRVMAGDTQE
jgi:hypothetical protein